MDFKPENVVRFHDEENEVYKLKAIDFDNSKNADELITSEVNVTLAYISP